MTDKFGVRHAKGYAAYARNDNTPRHKAVAAWFRREDGKWYCDCDYPVVTRGVK